MRNYVRLFVTGYPDWLVPAGFEERRFAVLDIGKAKIHLFDLSTIDRSELFYTDMEKHSAQGNERRALYRTPPAPKAFAPVVYASAFKEPQPVATGLRVL